LTFGATVSFSKEFRKAEEEEVLAGSSSTVLGFDEETEDFESQPSWFMMLVLLGPNITARSIAAAS
jgi:hypothetical protein